MSPTSAGTPTASSADVMSESPEFNRVLLLCAGGGCCVELLDLPRPLRLPKQ